MAVFRKIQIDFWQDAFILDLPFEEKGFYLYLLTNSKTKQCGIYEISHRVIELETGFSQEKIDQMLKKFIDSEKIKYDSETREILIVNWTKHNYSKALTVETCVKKELASVKSKILKSTFDTIYREYIGTIDTLSKEEKEEQKKEKKEEDKEMLLLNQITDLFYLWGREVNGNDKYKCRSLLKKFGFQKLKDAFKKAADLGTQAYNLDKVEEILYKN